MGQLPHEEQCRQQPRSPRRAIQRRPPQPIMGGMAPHTAPSNVLRVVRVFEQHVEHDVEEQRERRSTTAPRLTTAASSGARRTPARSPRRAVAQRDGCRTAAVGSGCGQFAIAIDLQHLVQRVRIPPPPARCLLPSRAVARGRATPVRRAGIRRRC